MSIGSGTFTPLPDDGCHLAECLVPGMTTVVAASLGDQVRSELARSRSPVSFLGSLLIPEDEVLLCLFTGPLTEVRALSERAGLPFERVLRCVGVGWTNRDDTPDHGPDDGPDDRKDKADE
jgi:hypothetical protein